MFSKQTSNKFVCLDCNSKLHFANSTAGHLENVTGVIEKTFQVSET